MNINFSFFKKYDFYKLMSDQADKTEEGINLLVDFVNNPSKEMAARVDAIETEADEKRRILIRKLKKSFVTPIDREDIVALSRVIDDIMDYAETTVEEMVILGVEPDSYIKDMVKTLCDSTKDIACAVRNIKDNPRLAMDCVIDARKKESAIEDFYREALADLFKKNPDNAIKILKTREVYRHLSNAADRVVDASNTIDDILVKNE
ncbi:DUF47 family protein [Patescibacteria group bacterium]|nr:DUF47 family protein [Patescibacteria group bacterium]